MTLDSLQSSQEVALVNTQVLALEECACQAVQATQNLTDNSFVMEDMAAMMPYVKDMHSRAQDLYHLVDESMVRSMSPTIYTTTEKGIILPPVNDSGETVTVAVEDFQDKILKFVHELSKISSKLTEKTKDAYYWLTTKQDQVNTDIKKLKVKSLLGVKDEVVSTPDWVHEGREAQTVDDCIHMAEHFLKVQLPMLLEYCKHCSFVLDEVDELVVGVFRKDIDSKKLTSLYKAHSLDNIEKIFNGSEIDVIDGKSIAVTQTNTRASTRNEMIMAVTSIQVTFEADGVRGKKHNTPSASKEQAQTIVGLVEQILTLTDIAKSNNELGVLLRQSHVLEKRVKKLEDDIEHQLSKDNDDEDQQHYRDIADVGRMMAGLTVQSLNFGIATYTTSMDVCAKLIQLVKPKI